MKRPQENILLSGILLVVFAIVIIIIFSFNQKKKINTLASRADSSALLLFRLSSLDSHVINHAGFARDYVLTGNTSSRDSMLITAKILLAESDSIQNQLIGNTAQKEKADTLAKYINKRIDFSNQLISLVNEKGVGAASLLYQTGLGRDYNNEILLITRQIQHIEMRSLQQDQKNSAGGIRNLGYYLLGLLIIILILTLFVILKLRMDLLARRNIELQLKKFNNELEEQVRDKTNKIRENEERYRTLAGIYRTTPEGTILNCNDTFARMLGYVSNKEIEQKKASQFYYTPVDREDVIARLQQKGKLNNGELKLKHKDGSAVYVIENCSLLRDDSTGDPIIEGILLDITERKKAEEQLQKNEIYLRGTLDATTDGILTIDDKGKVLGTNNRFAELWHIPQELIDQKDDNVLIEFVLDQLVDPKTFLSKVRELYNSDRADFDILHFKDNRILERYSTPLILNQQVVGRVWSFRDVTEQKKAENTLKASEQNLRQVLSSTDDIFYVIDRNYQITLINEIAKKNLSKAWGKPVNLGANILDLIPGESDEPIKSSFEKVFKGERIEYELYHPPGDLPSWVLVNYMPVSNESGAIVGAYIVTKDITERKHVEIELKKSEERYRTLIEQASDYIMITDGVGHFVDVNSSLCKAFGYSKEELLKMDIGSVIDPEQLKIQPIPFDLILAGKPVLRERRMVRKDGSILEVEANVKMLPDKRILAIARDITERKKAEIAIRASEETQKLIMNSSLDAIVCIDREGKITVWTPRAEAIFGWKEKDILGKPLADTIIPAQYKLRHLKGFQHYLQTGEHKVLNRMFEITAINQLGEEFPVELSIIPIKQGNQEFFCAFIRDITERKKAETTVIESEERYRTLVENAPEALVVMDTALGKFVNVSESAEKLFRMTRSELLNIGPLDVSPEYQPDGKLSSEIAAQKIKEAIAGDKPSFEWTHCDKDRNPISCEVWLVRLPSDNPILIRGSIIDITERKKAQEEIVKTNARFLIVAKATSDIVWDWNLQDESLWWNDNYYSNLGIPKEPESINAENWYERIHPDDRERARNKIQAAIKGDVTYWSGEYRFQKADGSYLNFLDRAYIMRNQQGQAYRMIGSMVDMTPVYSAQQEIAESENRLRTIFETEPECIKLLSVKGELLDMNPAGLAMIEADSLEMVIGHPVLAIVAPEYQKAFDTLTRNVFKGKSGILEFEIIGLKGTRRWLETHAVPMRDASGAIVALLGVTRNITERKFAEKALKESEEKYRTLVEQAVDAIALYDSNGKILDVNTGALALLGYSREELSKMTLSGILMPEDLLENPVRYDELREGKSTIKQRKMRKKDGTVVETEVRSQQLPDGRFLSVIRDLTERIKAEQELETSYQSIRKLTRHLQNIREEERAHIAREIHDELGQQLTVLKMDASWLSKKITLSDDTALDKMKSLISMLDETVRTVRRISSELRPSLLDDLGLMAAMEWQLSEFEKRSDIKTNLIASESGVTLSNSVKTALFRIFQESLTNVARHSGAQKVFVNLNKKENNFVLSIIDDGKGFDKQKIADKRTLGILGMQERSSMIGGTYEITSSPGQGTAVVVAIPLDKLSQN